MGKKRIKLQKNWILVDKLSRTEREGLFILMEVLGMSIYEGTRQHLTIEDYPYIVFEKDEMRVCGTSRQVGIDNLDGYQLVKYHSLVNELKEQIDKRKYVWK